MAHAADKGHSKVASAMGKGQRGRGEAREVVVHNCKGHREMVLREN